MTVAARLRSETGRPRDAPGGGVERGPAAKGAALAVATGYASDAGRRERNEDFCGMALPEDAELQERGLVLAVADGVGGGRGGREASEYTVRGLLADYYATPGTWPVPRALDRVLNANNRWLLAQASTHRELEGMATTLSALVLRGTRYCCAHVGDSRIYLLRRERLTRLTTDHVWDRPDMRHVLTRAIGLDPHLIVDYADGALERDDVFVLATDGVWEPLGDLGILKILGLHREPERAAGELVAAAIARGGQDNASAVVARVLALPEGDLRDALAALAPLAPPPKLAPGQSLDGFEILELVHESRETLLYKARRPDGTPAVLKTLKASLAGDEEACAALLAEEWMSRRVVSHYFPEVLPLAAGGRSALYYAMSWHEGATLEQRLATGAHFTVSSAVQLGIRLLKGVAALHRLDVIHRDIKPANLHLGADGRLRILDLGVALNRGAMHERDSGAPGTPSFMAPELLAGGTADAASDIYAAGVTLYHLLTRKYPYGEVEPFQHPRFGDPAPPSRYRPEIPGWLESVLLKAVARDRKARYQNAEEFLSALEQGERIRFDVPSTGGEDQRSTAIWRSIAIALFVLSIVLIYLLLIR